MARSRCSPALSSYRCRSGGRVHGAGARRQGGEDEVGGFDSSLVREDEDEVAGVDACEKERMGIPHGSLNGQIEQALAVQAFSSLDGVRVPLRLALGELYELVILRMYSVCFLSLAGICFTVASVSGCWSCEKIYSFFSLYAR
ncbi:uncharacterized protein LOC124698764 [Lolium rigidum]|uniref:uncharacterized protein LOC124698764 n=1 Tax=Lolium rigidum TaxID=89674 RepID=UPI001F5E217C|nr:uncharacterized protein LOC124698764 [Lolium rigidum]